MFPSRSLPRDLDLAAAVAWLVLAWLLALAPVLKETLLGAPSRLAR